MNTNRIEPEKITNPIQLMAAWFVAAVLLDGALLWAASVIEKPDWIPGFLCSSAVAIAILAMIAVFLMLTKFRPHLQGPKEYSRWLRDTSKMTRGRTDETITEYNVAPNRLIQNERTPPETDDETSANLPNDIELIKEIISCHMVINTLENCDEVVGALRILGFHVS